jgi:hypothetical protein
MKFIIIFLFSLTSIKSQDIQPKSFEYNTSVLKPINEVNYIITDIPNVDSLINFENTKHEEGKLNSEFYGFSINKNKVFINAGTWDTLENGDRIWRFQIVCPNAKSINLVLENLYIEKYSHLSIYSDNKKSLLGPYTNRINREHGVFASHLIYGESAIIELFEPKQDFDKNSFEISKIVYGYKSTGDSKNIKNQLLSQSASCNVDVNCPLGDEFCKEKYSTGIILKPIPLYDGLYSFCTGSLINNTRNDYKPYFLTALHCADDDENGTLSNNEKNNLDYWAIYFGYMKEYCGFQDRSPEYSYSGVDFRAGWSSTDFLLVELQEQPEPGETGFKDVFYSGWDMSGDIVDNVVGLHHPLGDLMKIAKDFDDIEIYGWPFTPPAPCSTFVNDDTHYKVEWDIGTTQNTSSGSPLFNNERKIIGQLHGGCDCTTYYNHAYYGRLSKSWEGNETPETQLKYWLDPDDTRVEVLDGIYTPNLHFGQLVMNSQNLHFYSYSDHIIGSSQLFSYKVESGAELILQAGREVVIKPCTYIKSGSEFHAFVQESDCDDDVKLSHKWSQHDPDICSTYPKSIFAEKQNDFPLILNSQLTLAPNPTSGNAIATVEVGEKSICSLTLLDNLGNEVITIFKDKELDPGKYQYDLEANNLSNGVYLCVLRIGSTMHSEKLVYLK